MLKKNNSQEGTGFAFVIIGYFSEENVNWNCADSRLSSQEEKTVLQRWVTAQDLLVTTESADAPALLSRDQKPPCDQQLWTMNTFLPFSAPCSFVPTSPS